MVIDIGRTKLRWKSSRRKKLDDFNSLLLEIAYRKLLFEKGLLKD